MRRSLHSFICVLLVSLVIASSSPSSSLDGRHEAKLKEEIAANIELVEHACADLMWGDEQAGRLKLNYAVRQIGAMYGLITADRVAVLDAWLTAVLKVRQAVIFHEPLDEADKQLDACASQIKVAVGLVEP